MRRSNVVWTLAITSLALFMVVLDNLVVSTALPVIRTDLGASIEELEWTVNAYTLTFAVFLLTGAALGDRFGRRRTGGTAAITVTVIPTHEGHVAARAVVQANEPDADALDNSSRVLTEVDPAADLSVRLTDTPDPVRVRERLTHGAEVVNAGPSSDAAYLTVNLPGGVRLVSVSAPGGDCRVERLTVECFFAGIEPGQRVTATIATTTKQAGTLTASASVSPFRAADPAPGNNSDAEATTVIR